MSRRSSSPGHIKRPMNAFMVYSKQRRKELALENLRMPTSKSSKHLGAEWKALNKAEKRPYVDEAKKIREQHMIDHPGHHFHYRKKPANRERPRRPSNNGKRAGGVSPGHIKQPMNSFLVYSKQQKKELALEYQGLPPREVSKLLGAKWKALNKAAKRPYINEAKKIREQHMIDHPGHNGKRAGGVSGYPLPRAPASLLGTAQPPPIAGLQPLPVVTSTSQQTSHIFPTPPRILEPVTVQDLKAQGLIRAAAGSSVSAVNSASTTSGVSSLLECASPLQTESDTSVRSTASSQIPAHSSSSTLTGSPMNFPLYSWLPSATPCSPTASTCRCCCAPCRAYHADLHSSQQVPPRNTQASVPISSNVLTWLLDQPPLFLDTLSSRCSDN